MRASCGKLPDSATMSFMTPVSGVSSTVGDEANNGARRSGVGASNASTSASARAMLGATASRTTASKSCSLLSK
jgi:hypothetical protein